MKIDKTSAVSKVVYTENVSSVKNDEKEETSILSVNDIDEETEVQDVQSSAVDASGSGQSLEDEATEEMQESIENATSYFDLVVLINYNSSKLDIDVQYKLKEAINCFGYDSNIDEVKEALLTLL